MCLLRLATLMMLATSVVHADVYNFPAKSVNIGSAYTEAFFAAHTLTSGGTGSISPAADAHAVHGVQLADGGFVLTGKAVESDGSSVHEAFAVKLDAAGSLVWGWKSGVSGQDAANAAAQLPNGEILIAGNCRENYSFFCSWSLRIATQSFRVSIQASGTSAASLSDPSPS